MTAIPKDPLWIETCCCAVFLRQRVLRNALSDSTPADSVLIGLTIGCVCSITIAALYKLHLTSVLLFCVFLSKYNNRFMNNSL